MRRRRSRSHSSEPAFLGVLFSSAARWVLALILLVAVVEWGSSIALKRVQSNRAVSASVPSDEEIVRRFDTDTPAPYRQALAEEARLDALSYAPFVEYRMTPYRGKAITIGDDGARANGRDAGGGHASSRVVVLGGDAVLGYGVPDEETIPAMLEADLLRAGKSVRVVNAGVRGYGSTQTRLTLESLLAEGSKPDLVVVLDGTEDLVGCRQPDGTLWSERLHRVERRPGLIQALMARSRTLALIGALRHQDAAPIGGGCRDDAALEATVRRLDANRRMMAAVAQAWGVKLLIAHQPIISYHYDAAKRTPPQALDIPPAVVEAGKGYARIAELRAAGLLSMPDVTWLEDLDPGQNAAYVDPIHYSPRFNGIIANALARRIVEGELLP